MRETRVAAAINAALDKARDHGKLDRNGDTKSMTISSNSAIHSARAPLRLRTQRSGSRPVNATDSTPQPTSAAAWLRKVDEGGTLYARSAGAANAKIAAGTVRGESVVEDAPWGLACIRGSSLRGRC